MKHLKRVTVTLAVIATFLTVTGASASAALPPPVPGCQPLVVNTVPLYHMRWISTGSGHPLPVGYQSWGSFRVSAGCGERITFDSSGSRFERAICANVRVKVVNAAHDVLRVTAPIRVCPSNGALQVANSLFLNVNNIIYLEGQNVPVSDRNPDNWPTGRWVF